MRCPRSRPSPAARLLTAPALAAPAFAAPLLLMLVLTTLARPGLAHEVGLSTVQVEVEGRDALVELGLSEADVLVAFPRLDVDGDGALSPGELEQVSELVEPEGWVSVESGEDRCPAQLLLVSHTTGDGIVSSLRARCPGGRATALSLPWLARLGRGHRSVVTVQDRADPGAPGAEAVLSAGSPRLDLGVEPVAPPVAAFFGIGVEHILIGADHLLFLLGLVLVARRRRDLLALVTSFTAAHSVTLSLAALGLVTLPPSLVEPAIAASVVYVGVENLVRPTAARRWRLTFLFGLVHGFGFAGVLAEIGLPSGQVGGALGLFNLGVEAGQLFVLLLVWPALVALRRFGGWERRAVPALSVTVALAGLVWLLERTGVLG